MMVTVQTPGTKTNYCLKPHDCISLCSVNWRAFYTNLRYIIVGQYFKIFLTWFLFRIEMDCNDYWQHPLYGAKLVCLTVHNEIGLSLNPHVNQKGLLCMVYSYLVGFRKGTCQISNLKLRFIYTFYVFSLRET